MFLFFDTETTGLPKNYKAAVTDLDNWPRIVQIAWMRFDKEGKVLSRVEYIIRPDGFEIPKEASDIHRITTAMALEKGIDAKGVFAAFAKAEALSGVIVGHNVDFDCKVVGAELIRAGIANTLQTKEQFCTMKSTVKFCKLPGMYGYKWPKLSELHQVLFGASFAESHSALADIEACAKCFWELNRRGILAVNKSVPMEEVCQIPLK